MLVSDSQETIDESSKIHGWTNNERDEAWESHEGIFSL